MAKRRGTKVDSKGRTSSQRLRSMKGRRFRRKFGEELLGQMGLGGSDFKSGGLVKGKLGLFAGPISNRKAGTTDFGGLPALGSPKIESNKSNPTLTTVVSQFDALIKSAKKLGVLTKDQQKELLSQLDKVKSAERETFIESRPDASSMAGAGISAESLAPLSTALSDLMTKLGMFGETIDEKLKDQEDQGKSFAGRFFDELGFGDEYDSYGRRKQARADRAASPENQKQKRMADREKRAKRFKPQDLLDKNGNRLGGGALDSKMNALQKAGKGGANIFSRATTGLAGLIGLGASRASSAARGATNVSAIRATLRSIARPLITKTLGRTALKSIPIIGAVAGLGFALDRLVKGDYVGAGLEGVSGLGSAMTAIPAMALAITRDAYSGVFGTQPEMDALAATRLPMLKKEVEELIKEEMSGQVKVQKKPIKTDPDKAIIPPTQPKPAAAVAKPKIATPPKPPVPPKAKKPQTSPSSSVSSGAMATSSRGGASSGGSSKTEPMGPSDSFNATFNPEFMSEIGTLINQESIAVEDAQMQSDLTYIPTATNGQLLPATGATTKPGASGMGDVRSPFYSMVEMGSIPNQVYY